MRKSDSFSLSTHERPFVYVSRYLEDLYARWHFDEVYLAPVDLCFSLLLQLLLDSAIPFVLRVQVTLEADHLRFVILGIRNEILPIFTKSYQLDEVAESQYKSVFLMQKLCDAVELKEDALCLEFYLGSSRGEPLSEINPAANPVNNIL